MLIIVHYIYLLFFPVFTSSSVLSGSSSCYFSTCFIPSSQYIERHEDIVANAVATLHKTHIVACDPKCIQFIS